MNYKKMPIYLCCITNEWSKNIQKKDSIGGHEYGKLNGKNIIWPKKINSETINPKNFMELKKQFNIEEILMIDRLIGTGDIVSIANHVNRSGQNFLRSKTPEGKYPQFPDMSKIYHDIAEFEKRKVHTIGPERFQNLPTEENVIWSEAIGLIAPVAHYVGIKVFAVGSEKTEEILHYL